MSRSTKDLFLVQNRSLVEFPYIIYEYFCLRSDLNTPQKKESVRALRTSRKLKIPHAQIFLKTFLRPYLSAGS